MWKPEGLITGIGSIPFLEPEPAIEMIMQTLPRAPHWPQLPKRGDMEGFVLQFLSPLIECGILARDGEKVYFATEDEGWADGLARFYALYLAVEEGDEAALDSFTIPEEAAVGFWAFLRRLEGADPPPYVKGQVVGPLTVGFRLTDAKGRPAYYDEQIRDVIVKNLALHARWQAGKLGGYARQALVFIDEPGASIYGQSTYITVTREMIAEDLKTIVKAIKAAGAKAGIHSCAAVDWGILYDAGPDIVSFDAYEYFSSLIPFRSETAEFIGRGGVLAWGIVPTSDKAYGETGESLAVRLSGYWNKAAGWGIDPALIKSLAIVTPACGTGSLDEALARRVYGLLGDLGGLLQGGR
ncbi:hypothetical protein ACP3TJ_02470 [Desulforudis sp. 1088]|uniref:hypothetical protein n=1 Tax=unclassified Candidatus Desulforudis TaxID=2635950 RepID=UPI003CE5BCA3